MCSEENKANCAPIEYNEDDYTSERSSGDYEYDEESCQCQPPEGVVALLETAGLDDAKFVCCYDIAPTITTCQDGFK